MKFRQIWNALPALKRLSALRKSPKMASKLRNYGKLIEVELNTVEENRQDIGFECAGVEKPTPPDVVVLSIPETIDVPGKDGAPATTVPNPQYTDFLAKFDAVLDGDSDLQPLDITLDELVDDLALYKGNSISDDDLELINPFFKP